ncbi:MAG TPA: NADH:flavin oxidoreductase [Syntrophus sp. (in: bacteria)]|nr:NADH:flavin oxidoreductase [Syntrophus sp. (in: bacteria)]
MKFVRLFEPIIINRLFIQNRMVMPAMGLHYTKDYSFPERMQHFYRRRAHGGVGLMILGPVAFDDRGAAPAMPGIFDDRALEAFRIFLDELHRDTQTKIAIQLFHMGRNAPSPLYTGKPALAPSALKSRLTGLVPQAMTEEDIREVQAGFARGAKRAKDAGFDMVEIIACTGYLVSQFLSPLTNLRKDAYGGPIENRMRFGLEVIRAVRAAVGPDFPIGIRVAGNDFMEGGHTNAESALFCREAERAGIDAINVTGGWHESTTPQLTSHVPPAAYVYLARGIKEQVGVPVFASNRLGDPVVAEQVLRSGAADMVGWARPLLADPDLPRKVRDGQAALAIRCISCNQGCFDGIFTGQGVTCLVNPTVGREGELKIVPARMPKKIYVAGGGPAGMEFAWVAALRGHDVTLFEKEAQLGGQVDLAAAPPGKAEFLNVARSLEARMRAAGVKVRRKSPLTAAKVKRGKPDLVAVATGSRPITVGVPGADKPHVVDAWEVLRGNVAHIGRRIVVIGGNAVGCETADFLVSADCPKPENAAFLLVHGAEDPQRLRELLCRSLRQVTVVEMVERMAANVGPSTRWVLMKDLRMKGVALRAGTKLVAITDTDVVVETAAGRESIPADTVVMAVGARSVNDLARRIEQDGTPVVTLGDAASPRNMIDAIREGFEAALTV